MPGSAWTSWQCVPRSAVFASIPQNGVMPLREGLSESRAPAGGQRPHYLWGLGAARAGCGGEGVWG